MQGKGLWMTESTVFWPLFWWQPVGNSFRRRAARQRVCDASNPTSHKPSNKLHVYILFLLFSFSCIINKLLTLFLYIAANQPITTPSFVNLCFLINYNLVQFKCYIYIYICNNIMLWSCMSGKGSVGDRR